MAHPYLTILKAFLLLIPVLNVVVSSYRPGPNDKTFVCSSGKNATITYQNNVNLLLSDFMSQSSMKTYYNTTNGMTPDRVYGFYMCRGDLSLKKCQDCIFNATSFARNADCDEYEGGVFISEKCIFQYTNRSTYGEWRPSSVVDNRPLGEKVSNYQEFNRSLTSTLDSLVNATSMTGFATREASVDGGEKIYSLAQCTPDLVEVGACGDCLTAQLRLLSSCCRGYQGAMLGVIKCQLKYDTLPFYHLSDGKGQHLGPVTYLVILLLFYNFLMLH